MTIKKGIQANYGRKEVTKMKLHIEELMQRTRENNKMEKLDSIEWSLERNYDHELSTMVSDLQESFGVGSIDFDNAHYQDY